MLGRLARSTSRRTSGTRCATALVDEVAAIRMGDVADFSNFMGAVIDEQGARRPRARRSSRRASDRRRILVGGEVDDSEGFFVEPTVIETRDPDFRLMREELFGPIVTAYVYADDQWRRHARARRRRRRTRSPAPSSPATARRSSEAARGAAVRGRQLLRQRQADRRRGRPAALRRRARVGHERQGRLDVEPDPLGQPAHDQGDVRAADGLPLPVHGPDGPPQTASPPPARRPAVAGVKTPALAVKGWTASSTRSQVFFDAWQRRLRPLNARICLPPPEDSLHEPCAWRNTLRPPTRGLASHGRQICGSAYVAGVGRQRDHPDPRRRRRRSSSWPSRDAKAPTTTLAGACVARTRPRQPHGRPDLRPRR